MPNWCENKIVIIGKNDVIQPMVDILAETIDGEAKFFEYFIPTPPEMLQESAPARDEETIKLFMQKYGAKDWYDWRVRNWGIKWDIAYACDIEVQFGDNDVCCLSFSCQTPWSPPEEGLGTLSAMFPNTYFYCEFFEPGMGFQGYCSYCNGESKGSETVSTFMKSHDVIDDFQYFYEENKEDTNNV